jgi:signal transduction histidine kinase
VRFQIAIIAVASLSLAALAILLVTDVIASTEQTLVAGARQQCVTAAKELAQQYAERARTREGPLEPLPVAAQDVSLRGLSAAVLRSFDAVTGGFASPTGSEFSVLGVATSSGMDQPRLAATERDLVRAVCIRSRGEATVQSVGIDHDIVIAAAAPAGPEAPVAWSLKRLAGARDPVLRRRQWWLAALVLSALAGFGGIVWMSIRLRRRLDAVGSGLQELETDFAYRMPAIGGEFGRLAQAINRMADRRAALESELRRQDRLAALGKVVAGVAHEIRNPLNSIRLSLELLDRRVRRGSLSSEEVAGALEEVDRLDRILSRLLAFGRPGARQREFQDLRPLIARAANIVRQQAQTRRVELVLEPNDPIEADVDGVEIEQVLINLLLNAIEASPEGAAVHVRAAREDGCVKIAVEDQGPGVPETIRDHIFDPYFTTKEAGNGLGLSVSREVASHHGGSLDLVTGGAGTAFVLRLPSRGRES